MCRFPYPAAGLRECLRCGADGRWRERRSAGCHARPEDLVAHTAAACSEEPLRAHLLAAAGAEAERLPGKFVPKRGRNADPWLPGGVLDFHPAGKGAAWSHAGAGEPPRAVDRRMVSAERAMRRVKVDVRRVPGGVRRSPRRHGHPRAPRSSTVRGNRVIRGAGFGSGCSAPHRRPAKLPRRRSAALRSPGDGRKRRDIAPVRRVTDRALCPVAPSGRRRGDRGRSRRCPTVPGEVLTGGGGSPISAAPGRA